MKKLKLLGFIIVVLALSTGTLNAKKQFKDGLYTGESQSIYTSEPYWGQMNIEIKNDRVTLLTFQIFDKVNKEVFGPEYEKHFKDNPQYIEQCRNEVNGIKSFTKAFQKTGRLEQVNAITGATWSHNLFKASMKVTLEKARNK